MKIRFNEAWTRAQKIANDLSDGGIDVVLVRDTLGRISFILDHLPSEPDLGNLTSDLRTATGPFGAPEPVRITSDLFAPEDILESPDLIVARPPTATTGRIALLERGVVGSDWTRSRVENNLRHVAMYGFKGGVGRSTATFMLAQHLANLGKCVLVVDLDLESPGIGALLQSNEGLPEYGFVDLIVESAVDNTEGLNVVCRSQVGAERGNGEIWLTPAGGRDLTGYLAKLNRIYADLPATSTHQRKSFAERLEEAIEYCESSVTSLSRKPDVVLLDSRAGIHDIAAVTLTKLSSLSFLFGADNPQTWAGYRAMFEQWSSAGIARRMGERLQMVSSMTPDKEHSEYLSSYRDHAQECFADTLYEDASPDDLDAFNFSVEDPAAPHAPIPISFNSDLVGLDPIRQSDWHGQQLIRAAFTPFLEQATELILEGGQ